MELWITIKTTLIGFSIIMSIVFIIIGIKKILEKLSCDSKDIIMFVFFILAGIIMSYEVGLLFFAIIEYINMVC